MTHSRWIAVFVLALVMGCASRSRQVLPQDNSVLAELYAQDQADRRAFSDSTWSAVERRDAERRRRVHQMLDAGDVRTAADHYHAAMVFQHGADSTSYRRAHELAREAERMGSQRARWLAAASLDRYLLSTGKPQHYGTQFTVSDGRWYLEPIDTTVVTDTERTRVGARTLDEIRAYLREQNGTTTASLEPAPAPAHERAPAVELVGGMEQLVARIEYPAAARAAGIEGRVRVQLVVRPDGTVEDAFVVDGLGHGLDEEALRLIRQARFINRRGEPHEIRMSIPFTR